MNKPQNLSGFRDFLPAEKRKRDYVVKKIIEIFERFGFEPLETPTLEYASLLLGKYGTEADKLVYTFKDKGDREVGLRYDQTVPSARVLAQYQQFLQKYFRRYQIQNVFRAEKPQKGRFREFTQCDIDIFGSIDPLSDAEILACTYFAYRNIGFPDVILKINDRATLFTNLEPFTNDRVNIFSLIQSIDKLDKNPKEDVTDELTRKGLEKEKAEGALLSIEQAVSSEMLHKIIDYANRLGVPDEGLVFDPVLARGLDYYTGMIFEVNVPLYRSGSLGGGGRYDDLIEQLGRVSIPAVGMAFGFDRTVEAADELGLIPATTGGTEVLVTIFNEALFNQSLEIIKALRANNIASEIYVSPGDKLEKQLKYADRKKIPFVVIIGPDEKNKGVVKLKNMVEHKEETLTEEELIEKLE